MRNLKVLSAVCITDDVLKDASCVCVDSDSDVVYFANTHNIFSYDCHTKQMLSCMSINFDMGNANECQIIEMDYIIEKQSFCLSFSNGDIFIYNVAIKEIECVGSVSSGLHAVAWSPDQEFLVLLTGEDTLILMTKDFDPVTEKNLHPSEFGESKPITVGWGSKETQFHGSEGKGAAQIKRMITKPATSWDDKKHRISWRGDGQLFVTSVIDPDQGCRKVRIWSREAVLQCTNEDVDELEQSLNWRPSGNLIACTQQHPNKHQVVFFEKNGLRHGEFLLPFQRNSFVVKELMWNFDSSVLAIWGHDMIQSSDFKYCLMLWTVNNYHWYLKQKLDFIDRDIKFVTWDHNHAYKLHILCSKGQYLQYTWGWTTSHTTGNANQDNTFVAVIDGRMWNVRTLHGDYSLDVLAQEFHHYNLDILGLQETRWTDKDSALLTPFQIMIIPPPMCAYSFQLPCTVNEVCFAPNSIASDISLILADGRIAVLKYGDVKKDSPDEVKLEMGAAGGNGFKIQVQPHFCSGIYSIKWENNAVPEPYPLSVYHWTWVKGDKLICVASCNGGANSKLLSVSLPQNASETKYMLGRHCGYLDNLVTYMCTNHNGTIVALLLNDGKVLKYDCILDNLSPWISEERKELILPNRCLSISICTVQEKDFILSLTDRFRLFCNSALLSSNCTSFYSHSEFLLLTTHEHTLKCLVKDLDIPEILCGQTLKVTEDSSRKIERGSKIILAVPGDTKVILQAPRGNIEVIHPRPLVLASVCKYLNDLQFGQAFELMKKHRINMNLLYDHNPKNFLENIVIFIEQLNSPNNINLFLTSLQNEDVSRTMYSSAYKARLKPEDFTLTKNKIDVICDAVKDALEDKDAERFFLTIITAHAKKSQPELDKALFKIKEAKAIAIESGSKPNVTADEAIKFLLYLVDVSDLYNVALGTYDFEMVIMIAEKSQKDPKEYLPFLKDLQKLEENYKKYKIDMYLHHYKKALQHISKCGEHFDECLSLIKAQRLYNDALYLFPPSSDHFKSVWRAYGDYLMEKKYYEEAGLAYTKGEDYEKALSAYQQSLNWQLVLYSAERLNYSPDKMSMIWKHMAEMLKGNQRYREASLLLEHFVKDTEESIVTLIEGQEWDTALHMMAKYNHLDIIETHMKPAVEDHYEFLNSHLEQLCNDFCLYNKRLQVIRHEKEVESQDHEYADVNYQDDDLCSDANSITDSINRSEPSKPMSGSLMTRRSSRSRRKQELKKYTLKEGSENEDLGLMAALSEIVLKVDTLKDNIQSFLRILVRFDSDANAKNLQKKMHHCIEIIESELPKIWTSEKHCSYCTTGFGPMSTASSIIATVQRQKLDYHKTSDAVHLPPTWRKKVDWALNLLN